VRQLSGVLAGVATALALLSAWHSVGHMRRLLREERATNRALTPAERRQAPVAHAQLNGQIFDFFAAYLAKGDRVYFQVRESGFSSYLDYQTAFAYAARYLFLPALQTTNLKDATVVVTYFEDPKQLHVHYITQQEAGLQPIFVSRIRAP